MMNRLGRNHRLQSAWRSADRPPSAVLASTPTHNVPGLSLAPQQKLFSISVSALRLFYSWALGFFCSSALLPPLLLLLHLLLHPLQSQHFYSIQTYCQSLNESNKFQFSANSTDSFAQFQKLIQYQLDQAKFSANRLWIHLPDWIQVTHFDFKLGF